MSSLNLVTRYSHLFVDGEDQYLFVKNLGRGAYSRAQLVLHLQSGELRVRKIVSALYFIGSCGILHADLHDENMFVNYEGGRAQFYIGDFGLAERGALTDPMNSFTDDACMLHMSLRKWMNAGPPVRETDVLRQYLLDVVDPILYNLGATPSDRLPSLEELLDALQDAPEGPPEPLTDRFAPEEPDWHMPMYHATEEAALDADAVAGPWHLAKVSLNIWTNDVTVVGISSETYDNKEIWEDSLSDFEDEFASEVSMDYFPEDS
ncbi:polo-like kinase 3 [Diaporthe australafricana]|uniref:Polo-like kinase 3 n=1 Tax=Diaporthe australafricana TaxID=127596 RepID=A0ABR3XVJ8_9PEZI